MTRMLLRVLSDNYLTRFIPVPMLILFLLLSLQEPAVGQDTPVFGHPEPPSMEMVSSVRERFRYNVRYGFLNLGEVEVFVTPDTVYRGRPVIHLRTVMKSNPRIPLVGRREVHYQSFSGITEHWPYSYLFWRDDVESEVPERYLIEFDRLLGEVRFFEEGAPKDTLDLEDPASGGDVIFIYSRTFAGSDSSYELPVYIEDEKGVVKASNSPNRETRDYDAFPEPIETYRSDGTADIDGPFGFTGEFTAWFATDELRIPLEVHTRIIFGNVRVRLVEYERLP
ncbi:MAG: DUF3108 domain-containing protein [Balneolaceae bacterium]